jgi:hypothetical protein
MRFEHEPRQTIWDIIPDIHGHADKLEGLLTTLGYAERGSVYRNRDRSRRALFLGDYIDRGPDNGRVIDIVRRWSARARPRRLWETMSSMLFSSRHCTLPPGSRSGRTRTRTSSSTRRFWPSFRWVARTHAMSLDG